MPFYCTAKSKDQECLQDLLQLWTGWPSLSTMGEKFSVSFLTNNGCVMPAVDYCFNLLKIPTVLLRKSWIFQLDMAKWDVIGYKLSRKMSTVVAHDSEHCICFYPEH